MSLNFNSRRAVRKGRDYLTACVRYPHCDPCEPKRSHLEDIDENKTELSLASALTKSRKLHQFEHQE